MEQKDKGLTSDEELDNSDHDDYDPDSDEILQDTDNE